MRGLQNQRSATHNWAHNTHPIGDTTKHHTEPTRDLHCGRRSTVSNAVQFYKCVVTLARVISYYIPINVHTMLFNTDTSNTSSTIYVLYNMHYVYYYVFGAHFACVCVLTVRGE